MDDNTWVLLRIHDDNGMKLTHLPTDQRVVARGSRDDMRELVHEYASTFHRHKETGERRVVTNRALAHANLEGGPLLTWLLKSKVDGDASRVLALKESELVFHAPDPPTSTAYRVRVLVPGSFIGTDKDTWLPMSRIFATEGEAAQWAKGLAATYRVEQEDTE